MSLYELELFLEKGKIDVACIQETKLVPTDKFITFNGYASVRKDRKQQKEAIGGGLLILIWSELKYQRVTCSMAEANPGMEGLSFDNFTGERQTRIRKKPVYATDNLTNPHENWKQGWNSPANWVKWNYRKWPQRLWRTLGPHSNLEKWGAKLAESRLEAEAIVLNDGSGTRQDPASGRLTALDITILDQNLRVTEECRAQRALHSDQFALLLALELTGTQDEPEPACMELEGRWLAGNPRGRRRGNGPNCVG